MDSSSMIVQVGNPSFCYMVKADKPHVLGTHASAYYDDISDFHQAWNDGVVIRKEKRFPRFDTYLRLLVFPMKDEKIINVKAAHEQNLLELKH